MPERVRAIVESDDKEKCKLLGALTLSDQDVSVAEQREPTKPGVRPVEDGDQLARVMESPIHVLIDDPDVRESLTCTPSAFGDAYNKGLSVQRLSMTTEADVEVFGRGRAAERGKQYLGFVTCAAVELRAARRAEALPRLLSVFATPLDGLDAHADVCVHRKPDRLDKEYLKFYFWDVFKGREFVARILEERDAANQPTA